ncbi:MAG: o-succinylbenzoate synthase [Saprospiraceae bacterium]|nr:o-succinylbenzoate synthase [Saprospiraceae bacterium]
MNCFFKKYILHFKVPGSTSRGILKEKLTYFIFLEDGTKTGIGECNLFKGLSADDRPGYDEKLEEVCGQLSSDPGKLPDNLEQWPSIRFGVEALLLDWENGGKRILFPEVIGQDGFRIPANGLIWMGSKEEMMKQVHSKLNEGFTSIKLKIGAIDFEGELDLIRYIRSRHSAEEVEIRLDANGAFSPADATERLKRLSDFDINYIEQPIKAGQWQEMAALVAESPIKIALDEELIGISGTERMQELVNTISPHILILKPALVGGIAACNDWMKIIESYGGQWVITSALESNIGLNAIAMYAATKQFSYAQGLGTGMLYTNNFPSPYTVDASGLRYHPELKWDLSRLYAL